MNVLPFEIQLSKKGGGGWDPINRFNALHFVPVSLFEARGDFCGIVGHHFLNFLFILESRI
jgi:hypothetical protein